MDAVSIYGIAASGILLLLIVVRLRFVLYDLTRTLSIPMLKYIIYPYILRRHRWVGPWTWAGIIKCLVYAVSNGLVILYQVDSWNEVSVPAGRLALVNMAPLFMAPHLGLLAELLGISLQACQSIHHAAGWMTSALVTLHIVTIQEALSADEKRILFAIIGSVTLATMMICAVPIFRRRIYELFLRIHHSLAVVYFYSIWRHLPSDSVFPRLYLYVPLSILGLTTLYQLGNFLYQNSILSSRPSPRATITCKPVDPDTTKGDKGNGNEEAEVLKICVTLGKPLAIKAGQYIQLWMPSVSFGSWMQSHPFVVTSWSPEKQNTLELFVQVHRGFTSKLHKHASINGSASFPVFVTGPFGISHSLNRYETVLAVASNFGIAGLVPYIKQLLYGYNTSTARIRRVHLVWETRNLDLVIEAQPLLNSLLKDDVLDNGYILQISIYVETAQDDGESFGNHNRAFRYQGKPNYRQIISAEAAGDYIERISNAQEEIGETLILTSVSDGIRDQLRGIVRGYLGKRVEMREVEFRPV